MQRGYVKIWRRLLDSRVWQSDGLLRMWIWCLLEATHKEIHVPVKTGRGETIVTLKPGQLIYGRRASAKKIRCKPATGRNLLKKLFDLQKLDIQPDTHFSIITIRNWDRYQVQEKKEDNQQDRQRTPKGHPKDTNKNVKNEKKKEIPSICTEISQRLLDLIRRRDPDCKEPNLETWAKHIDSLMRIDGRSPATITAVVEWCQQDHFWQTNILSTSKLRQKFSTLYQKMNSNGNRSAPAEPACRAHKPFDPSELERDE